MGKNLKTRLLEVSGEVMNFRPFKDENGRFIPYCDFGYHQGIPRNYKVCEKRGCSHYKRLNI